MITSALMQIDETPEARVLTDDSLPNIQPTTEINFNYYHTMCQGIASRICFAKEKIPIKYVGIWIRLVSFENNGYITDCEPVKLK